MKKKILSGVIASSMLMSAFSGVFAADLSSPFIYKNSNGGYTSVVKSSERNLNSFMAGYGADGRINNISAGQNIGSEDGYNYYKTDLSSAGVIKSFLMDANAVPKTSESIFDATYKADHEYEYSDDFESAVQGSSLPRPYGWFRWSTGNNISGHDHSKAGVGEEADGNKYLYIMNNQNGYGGFGFDNTGLPLDRFSYTVSFDVKYEGGTYDEKNTDKPYIGFNLYKGTQFVRLYGVDTTPYDFDKGGWQRVSGSVNYFDIASYDYDDIRIAFGTGNQSGAVDADSDTMKICIDNLEISVDEVAESNYVFTDDFESASDENTKAGWGYYNWGKQNHNDGATGYATEENGNKSLSLLNNKDGYSGYNHRLDGIPLYQDSYTISYDVKYDEGITTPTSLNAMFMLYNDSTYVVQCKYDVTGYDFSKGGWQRLSTTVSRASMQNVLSWYKKTEADYNRMEVVIGSNSSSDYEGKADDTSKIYFDNVKVIATAPDEFNGGIAKIRAYNADGTENKYSWYQTGNKVVYKFEDQIPLKYEQIQGIVYDIDNNVVEDKSMLSYAVLDGGWSFTPSEKGYYEIEFYGIDKFGDKTAIRDGYGYGLNGYQLERTSFAVVDGTKPMSERNDSLMSSNNCSRDEYMDLLDIVGFSGVRIHTIPWGTGAGNAPAQGFQIGYSYKKQTPGETNQGDFNWNYTDKQMVRASRFKNIIPNIFATPTFATKGYYNSDKFGEYYARTDAWSVVGAFYANLFMPDATDYPQMTKYAVKAFMERYLEKYPEQLYGIEFWNEPYYGEHHTAFWYDTAENYKTMTNEAWEAVDEVRTAKGKNDFKFITAGHLGSTTGSRFMSDMLADETYKKNTEMISFHGGYGTGEQFQSVADAVYGKGNIELMNSEGYYYTYRNPNEVTRDYKQADLAMLATYMRETKAGYKFKGYFQIIDDTLYIQDEISEANQKASSTYGLFRGVPTIQPHSGAVVMHEFFELMGKNFTYDNEYDVSGIKAVSFNNDGKKFVVFWNPKGEDFTVSKSIRELASNTGSKVLDYEGKSVGAISTSTVFKGSKMYYIVDANETELAKLTATPDTALNAGYKAPYYTCEGAPTKTEKSKDTITVNLSSSNFSDAFNHTWVNNPLSEEPNSVGAHSVKVKIESEGLSIWKQYYLSFQIESRDDEPAMAAKNGNDLINYDSLVLSFNATGEAGQEDTFYIGLINSTGTYGTDRVPSGTPVIYKAHAYGGAGQYQTSPAGTTLKEKPTIAFKTWNHYHTGKNNDAENWIRYTFRIPVSEIAGLNVTTEGEVKMSIADIKVGYNPEKEKKYTKYGAWTFGDGLYPFESSDSKYNVADHTLFGTLKFTKN